MDDSSVSDVRVKTDAAFPVLLSVLFVFVYTQGYLERSGLPSGIVKTLVEAPVLLILMHVVNRGLWQPTPGLLLVGLYTVWAVVSGIFSGDGVLMTFLYVRYVLYGYIIFVAVLTTPLTRSAVMRINGIIIALFVFQILASAHEVFILGERVEAHVGALCAEGGGLATEFPLLAMGLTVAFYLLWRANPLLLVLSWAFFLVGYASGKRAIYFLGPCLYVCILGWYVIRVRSLQALKRSLGGIVVLLCLVPLLLLGMSRSHGITDATWSRPFERITYALHAAVRYTTAQDQAGRTMGRTATSRRVFATLWSEDAETVLFGWGPRAARIGAEERYEKLMITYGIAGWARDVICIGWPGALLYVLLQFRLFQCLQNSFSRRVDGYWEAMRFAAEIAFLVMLVSYFTYSSSFPAGGHLSYVYFYLFAISMSPIHRHLASRREWSNGEVGAAPTEWRACGMRDEAGGGMGT